MTIARRLAVLLSTWLLALLPVAVAHAADPVLVGRVIKVTDGDTLKVQLSSGPITVRLDSIDAPEKDQPWGAEATAALARLVANKTVELDVVTQDRYERLVALVNVDGLAVNEQLVKDGHAWAFRRYLKKASGAKYCAWEASARSAKRGLWSLKDDDWIYPSDWRRLQRGTTNEFGDFRGETTSDCVAAIGRK